MNDWAAGVAVVRVRLFKWPQLRCIGERGRVGKGDRAMRVAQKFHGAFPYVTLFSTFHASILHRCCNKTAVCFCWTGLNVLPALAGGKVGE